MSKKEIKGITITITDNTKNKTITKTDTITIKELEHARTTPFLEVVKKARNIMLWLKKEQIIIAKEEKSKPTVTVEEKNE